MLPLPVKIRIRRWRWIEHVLDGNNIARTALTWTPEGKRRPDRPRTTWKKSVEREQKEMAVKRATTAFATDRDG